MPADPNVEITHGEILRNKTVSQSPPAHSRCSFSLSFPFSPPLFFILFSSSLPPHPDNCSCSSNETSVLSCKCSCLRWHTVWDCEDFGNPTHPRSTQISLGSSGVAWARELGSWGHCLGLPQEYPPAYLVSRAPGAASKNTRSLSLLSSLMLINAVKKLCTGVATLLPEADTHSGCLICGCSPLPWPFPHSDPSSGEEGKALARLLALPECAGKRGCSYRETRCF